MARVNGNRKGKAGEREAAKAWAMAIDCDARRGQQFCGGSDSPDVVHEVEGIHLEVKRTARGYNVQAAIDQAREDGDKLDIPVALTRQDRGEWIASVPLELLMILVDKLADRKWKLGKEMA